MNEGRKVELAAHDPAWAAQAQTEGARVVSALGTPVLAMHHIGSTAIAGILAKPIVDMMGVVTSLADIDAHERPMRALGYDWRGEFGIAGRRFCPLDDPRGRRIFHVHFYADGHPEIEGNLAFRDYMRPTKRNERPTNGSANTSSTAAYSPVYFYTFTRPGFTYERILIEHDEAGKGNISFLKSGFDEMITDPIQLTAGTMENLTTAFTVLNFLASNENYQTPRDHSNMGNISITVKKDGRTRTAKYNWTENKQAKALMDEYRRIGNEYTWKFEIGIARQNQPLQAPGLMNTLDTYIKQNEISDPQHLVTLLTELSTDERLPLIARDQAVRISKQIEKAKK